MQKFHAIVFKEFKNKPKVAKIYQSSIYIVIGDLKVHKIASFSLFTTTLSSSIYRIWYSR